MRSFDPHGSCCRSPDQTVTGGLQMSQTDKQERMQSLFQLIAEIDDPEDIRALFAVLCTAKEVENMAERCYAAKLLLEGNTYNQVMAQADISSATLSRVSRCVQYGSGYARLLKRKEKA